MHSFGIRDHVVLEWKSTLNLVESTLKIVESTIKRVTQPTNFRVDSTPNEVTPNIRE